MFYIYYNIFLYIKFIYLNCLYIYIRVYLNKEFFILNIWIDIIEL